MQSWLPDEFDRRDAANVLTAPAPDPGEFDSDLAVEAGDDAEGRRFCRETGFTDGVNLMAQMTRDERRQVFELVEVDVAARYEQRVAALEAEQQRAVAEIEAEYETRLRTWMEEFGKALDDKITAELRAAAGAAARLAVRMAEKIVRAEVSRDPDVLTRVIETTLFKIQDATPLEVSVNPEDAARLEQDAEIRKKLNIGRIVSDRRVEKGGCLIRSGGWEWDASLGGQLETLAELVEESVTTAGSGPVAAGEEEIGPETDIAAETRPAGEPEDDHDPGLA